jgi:hypothetical protein
VDPSVGQLELALLRARLHSFSRRFYEIAGPRYLEFDEARAQAAKLRARFMPAAHRASIEARETARACAEECALALRRPFSDPERLKLLHRDLARHFHPDLASDGARRVIREKLMTEVNIAFEAEDVPRLELLARALDHDENGDAARQLAELSGNPVNELRERTDFALRQGFDLLAELARHLSRQAAEVKQRGARNVPGPGMRTPLIDRALRDLSAVISSRRVVFPGETSMGQLFVRAERDIDDPMILLGEAQGTLAVPIGKSAILRLSSQCTDLSPLRTLDKHDLHGLIDEWPDFVNLNDAHVQCLAHFPGLEVIQLGRTEITGRVFDSFRSLHELRVLVLEETQFDDEGLLRLEECVWMQRLDVSFTQVTGPGLRAIRNMTALRELSLYGTSVSDSDLAVLAHVRGLRNLNLGLTAISDRAAAHLAELRLLEVLNLGGTAVTDAILDALATLPALRELVLWETAVTPAGLDKLRSFAALRYLDVDQTKVPPEALIPFRGARPDVRLPSDIWVEA